jgi:ParB family transcriptional regulator, chromosome partitioning protein
MEMTYEVGSALSLSSEKGGCSLESHAKNILTSLAHAQLDEIHNRWLKRIPEDPTDLWQWLLDQEQAIILDLLAFCIGQTVHAVRLHHDGRQPRFVAADQLAQAVKLDMADWWTPTGESYLGRVKKDQILPPAPIERRSALARASPRGAFTRISPEPCPSARGAPTGMEAITSNEPSGR